MTTPIRATVVVEADDTEVVATVLDRLNAQPGVHEAYLEGAKPEPLEDEA